MKSSRDTNTIKRDPFVYAIYGGIALFYGLSAAVQEPYKTVLKSLGDVCVIWKAIDSVGTTFSEKVKAAMGGLQGSPAAA